MGLFSRRHRADDSCSDTEIITRFRETGDLYFTGLLYARYGHLVLGLCFKYLRNKMEAEDAVMNIFSKLPSDLQKHNVQYFKSWLYVYSKNHCLMELRKRQSRLKKELDLNDNIVLVMDYSDSSHLKEKEEQIALLETAIGRLNEEQQQCIRLFFLENLSYAEICSKTGYSNNEVKSHIQNGKRNLRISLETKLNERSGER